MDIIKQDADTISVSVNSLEEFNFNNIMIIYAYLDHLNDRIIMSTFF